MIKKFFEKTMNSLKLPESDVDELVKTALKAELSGKVITMKTTKRYRKFTAICAIAASLALVIALGAIFYPSAIKNANTKTSTSAIKQNGFFITANAATATDDEAEPQKITADNFVKIGKVVPTVGFVTFKSEGKKPSSFTSLFNYDLRCEGENIEKITYKIDNAVFCVKNGYKYVVDKDGQNDLFKLYGLTVGEKGEYNAYNSYTVNYDNQPDLSKYADEVTAPLQILGTFNEKNPNSGTRVNDKEVLSELYNSIFKDTVITVTATFKDGSTESQKLKLNCDSKGDEAFVEAKIIK